MNKKNMGKIELIFEESENEIAVNYSSLNTAQLEYLAKAYGYNPNITNEEGEIVENVPLIVWVLEDFLKQASSRMFAQYESENKQQVQADATEIANII